MNLKRRLALFSASGLLGISLIAGGATYAIFTDSATNNNNNFTSGTIDLDQTRDLGDTIPGPMFYSSTSDPTGKYPYDKSGVPLAPPGSDAVGGWAPGDHVLRAMNLFNKGSLDAKVTKLKADISTGATNSGVGYNQFINKMNIKIMYPAQNRVLYNGPLSGLLNGWVNISAPFAIYPGGPANITFEATLDESADNDIMGQTFVFDFSFYAEQLRNN
ncbi:TasA family protein [Paenibacillus sp. BSR1-1]|uniref:TasA family protein n=1 Tax=Paenibacillus sp. BSR1-1 TaxID=3020845 RepID=UPI0025B20F5A|nr:TasA family protein [Paenibacillus sp. BSR1-1]MDN3016815.1 TasA family protein [Paenibacillus sp. BSR1-1]